MVYHAQDSGPRMPFGEFLLDGRPTRNFSLAWSFLSFFLPSRPIWDCSCLCVDFLVEPVPL